MANRKLQLVSQEVGNLLIKQIAHELKNHSLYKSFANYFSVEGVPDLETYYNKRASEEYKHHEWIIDYLSESNCKVMYPAIEQNTEVISDYITPFSQTITREILTTQMIYTIYDLCLTEKDYMTAAWLLEKLIKEQHEEESLSLTALDIMDETSDIYLRAEKVLDLLGG